MIIFFPNWQHFRGTDWKECGSSFSLIWKKIWALTEDVGQSILKYSHACGNSSDREHDSQRGACGLPLVEQRRITAYSTLHLEELFVSKQLLANSFLELLCGIHFLNLIPECSFFFFSCSNYIMLHWLMRYSLFFWYLTSKFEPEGSLMSLSVDCRS